MQAREKHKSWILRRGQSPKVTCGLSHITFFYPSKQNYGNDFEISAISHRALTGDV